MSQQSIFLDRTLSTEDASFLLLAHAGGILIGAAGVTLGAAPPVVSATWFPENERIFATSLTTVSKSHAGDITWMC